MCRLVLWFCNLYVKIICKLDIIVITCGLFNKAKYHKSNLIILFLLPRINSSNMYSKISLITKIIRKVHHIQHFYSTIQHTYIEYEKYFCLQTFWVKEFFGSAVGGVIDRRTDYRRPLVTWDWEGSSFFYNSETILYVNKCSLLTINT